jgi:hypothetical protein
MAAAASSVSVNKRSAYQINNENENQAAKSAATKWREIWRGNEISMAHGENGGSRKISGIKYHGVKAYHGMAAKAYGVKAGEKRK